MFAGLAIDFCLNLYKWLRILLDAISFIDASIYIN